MHKSGVGLDESSRELLELNREERDKMEAEIQELRRRNVRTHASTQFSCVEACTIIRYRSRDSHHRNVKSSEYRLLRKVFFSLFISPALSPRHLSHSPLHLFLPLFFPSQNLRRLLPNQPTAGGGAHGGKGAWPVTG